MTDLTDTIAGVGNALQTYVVAPLAAFGLGGYVFNLQGEDTATLSSDITDHYSEDNKAIQDHIAIKPKRITLRGYVGELVYNTAGQSPTILQTVTQKLTQISAFLPALSASAAQAQALIGSVSGAVSSGTGILDSLTSAVPATANIYGLVTNLLGTTTGDTKNQQSAYQYFSACQSTGTLMGIQTPWEFLTNMVIETIVAIQSEDSIFMTDFQITYKQMRFAASTTVAATAASILSGTGTSVASVLGQNFSQAITALQGSAPANLGSIPGSSTLISLSNSLNNPLGSIFQHVAP